MWKIRISSRFKKDTKKLFLNKTIEDDFVTVIRLLAAWVQLPEKYNDHRLQWDLLWCRECHVRPDLLLIYKYEKNELILLLIRAWSHSELFG